MWSAFLADKGHLCTQWMKWILSHLPEPAFALIPWDPWEGRSLAERTSRMVIFASGAAHSFLLGKCITFAWNKSCCQEPGQPPQVYASHRKGSLGEVTGGEVQRAVPKSAHCWGIHVTWGDSMILRVPIMPLICFIDCVHTSEPAFFSRAKPWSGRQSYRSRKRALNPHGGQCHTHMCLCIVFLHQKLNQRCGLKMGKRTLGDFCPGSKTGQTHLETRNAARPTHAWNVSIKHERYCSYILMISALNCRPL